MKDKANTIRHAPRRILHVLGAVLLMAAFTTGAIGLQHLQLKKIKSSRPYADSLFLPRKEFVKEVAFGYDMFLADFFYLRSIQAFGGQWRSTVKDYSGVANYFESIVELDPFFIEAYEFGSMVLSENTDNPEKALELNEFGHLKDPRNYKLCYWNAYISWWILKDPIRTKFWVRMAAKDPDCPDYVKRLEAYVDKETGQYLAALDRWIQDYLDAVKNREGHMISIARGQFLDIAEKWNLDILSQALQKYRDDNEGRLPETVEELSRAGYLNQYQACDYTKLMNLLQVYEMTGIVPPRALENVAPQVIVSMSGVPPSPYGSGEEPRYFIRKDVGPEHVDAAVAAKQMILGWSEAREIIAGRLAVARRQVEQYRSSVGRLPLRLEEVDPNNLMPVDMVAGRWDYNPDTGIVNSPTFPDL